MKLRNNSGDIQSDPDMMPSEGAPITKQDVIDGRVYPNRLVYMKYLMQRESEENPKTLGVQSLHGDGKNRRKTVVLENAIFFTFFGFFGVSQRDAFVSTCANVRLQNGLKI